jgi:hypothetical protein
MKRTFLILAVIAGLMPSMATASYAQDCPTNWNMQAPTVVVAPAGGFAQAWDRGTTGAANMDGLGYVIFTQDAPNNSVRAVLAQKQQILGGNLVSSTSTLFSSDQTNWTNNPLGSSSTTPFFFGGAYGSVFFSNYRLLLQGLSGKYMKVSYSVNVNGCPLYTLESQPTRIPEISTVPIGIDAAIKSMVDHGFFSFTQSGLVKTAILNLENQLTSTNFIKRTARPRDLDLPWSLPPHIGILDLNNCTDTYGNALSIKGNSCLVTLTIGDDWIVDQVMLHASKVSSNKTLKGAKKK